MNYIKEINSFYDWLLYNPLPTGAIALWNALMSINNKAGWADEFTVANLVLQGITGLSRQGLDNSRNLLMQKGLIKYKKGTSNQAGRYKMISFDSQKVGTAIGTGVGAKDSDKDVECKKIGTEVGTEVDTDLTQEGHNSSTLNKLNKTKLNKTKTTSSSSEDISLIANEFEQNGFGAINATVKDLLINLSEQYSTEWIIEAMKIAVKANARNIRYVEGILRRWNNSGGMKLSKENSEEPESAENIYGW